MAYLKIFLNAKSLGELRVADDQIPLFALLPHLTVSSEEQAVPSIQGLPDGRYRCAFRVVGTILHRAPEDRSWDGGYRSEEKRPSQLDVACELHLTPEEEVLEVLG